MNKQTKQLVVLIVLVVALGGVAAWNFGVFGGDDPAPAPATDPAAAGPAAAGPANPTGQPAGQPAAQPSQPGQPAAAPGQAPQTVVQDLEIPEEVVITPPRYDWPVRRGGADDIPDPRFPIFDPLKVQNIDVVDPDRKKYIEQLKEEWVLDGITVTVQKRVKIDDTGKPMIGESVMEPKPATRMVPQLDEYGLPVFGPDGQAVLVEEVIYDRDAEGNPILIPAINELGEFDIDDAGNVKKVPKPKYVQAKDEDGNPVYDNRGNPVWEMQPMYRNGRRVVKRVPLKIPRQLMSPDGEPLRDANGKPIIEWVQAYEQATDSEGKLRFDQDGNPVWVMETVRDESGEVVMEDGKPKMVPKMRMVADNTPQTEVVPVKEAWFKEKVRPFRELDRLTNTRFTIQEIFIERVYVDGNGERRVRSGVDLLGDTGAKITLFLADDSRYEKED